MGPPAQNPASAERWNFMRFSASYFVMTFANILRSSFVAALFVAFSPVSTGAGSQNSLGAVVTTEQVRAELMAHAPDGVDPGNTVWVGLQLAHQPEWHTYWKSSGDSGQPTSLNWTLPAGVSAGEIAWPLPVKIPIGTLANYGYDGTVLLPVPLTISPDFKPSSLTAELEVKLQASWLVCKQECVPQDGQFVLRIPTKGSTAFNSAAFNAAFKAQPKALTEASSITIEGSNLKVSGACVFFRNGIPMC